MIAPIAQHLPDEAATMALGQKLAKATLGYWQTHGPTTVHVHLTGDLGAGKSTLARAWLRALGVQGTIRSPTYTLVELYDVEHNEQRYALAHLDLYRLHDADELTFMGFDELCASSALMVIEWPQRAAAALPAPLLSIELKQQEEGRVAVMTAPEAWQVFLA